MILFIALYFLASYGICKNYKSNHEKFSDRFIEYSLLYLLSPITFIGILIYDLVKNKEK